MCVCVCVYVARLNGHDRQIEPLSILHPVILLVPLTKQIHSVRVQFIPKLFPVSARAERLC